MTEKEIDLLEKMMKYTVAKMNSDRLAKVEWHSKIQEIKKQLLQEK